MAKQRVADMLPLEYKVNDYFDNMNTLLKECFRKIHNFGTSGKKQNSFFKNIPEE